MRGGAGGHDAPQAAGHKQVLSCGPRAGSGGGGLGCRGGAHGGGAEGALRAFARGSRWQPDHTVGFGRCAQSQVHPRLPQVAAPARARHYLHHHGAAPTDTAAALRQDLQARNGPRGSEPGGRCDARACIHNGLACAWRSVAVWRGGPYRFPAHAYCSIRSLGGKSPHTIRRCSRRLRPSCASVARRAARIGRISVRRARLRNSGRVCFDGPSSPSILCVLWQ